MNIMRLAYIIVFTFLYIVSGSGQNIFKVIVLDKETQEPLPGATANIQGTTIGGSANESGLIEIPDVPNGNHAIEFSFLGYEQQVAIFIFPQTSEEIPKIFLEASEEELEEIIISSTRS